MEIIPEKLFTLQAACEKRKELSRMNKRVVLTNGCFDMLHAGHVFSLKQAKNLGDSLWIALNSDASIKILKGPQRPIFPENIRAYMLSELSVVDGIFIFQKPRLTNEISAFAPDVYVKSGDYTIEKLDPDERTALEQAAVEIVFMPFLNGFSTTTIIEKIKSGN